MSMKVKSLKEYVLSILEAIKILSDECNNINLEKFIQKINNLNIISKLNNYEEFQMLVFRTLFNNYLHSSFEHYNYRTNIEKISTDNKLSLKFNIEKYSWYGKIDSASVFLSGKQLESLNDMFNSYMIPAENKVYKAYIDSMKKLIYGLLYKLKTIIFRDDILLNIFRDFSVEDINKNIDNIIKYVKSKNELEAYISQFRDVRYSFSENYENDDATSLSQKNLLKKIILVQEFFNKKFIKFNNFGNLEYTSLFKSDYDSKDIKIFKIESTIPFYISFGNHDGLRLNCSNIVTVNNELFDDEIYTYRAINFLSKYWDDSDKIREINVGTYLC